jgi:glycosyltransferase involved in cell wall biosynthesis
MNKVLFLSPNLGLGGGGAERQIVTVASLLKDSGYDVEFLCYADGNFYEDILKKKEITVHYKLLPNYLKRMIFVRRFIRKGKYNAVVSFLETPNFLNNFAAIGGKTWKVITGERSAKERTFLSRRGKIFCRFQRFADYIVCNSDNAKQMWMNYCPQYSKKLVTIYNAVIFGKTNSAYVPKREGRLNVVVAASYQSLKNAIGLINALALFTDIEREKIHVDWYGNKNIAVTGTKIYEEAVVAVEKYGLEGVISLREGTNDINNKMFEADVVGLFSKYEGLPNALCEGMMLGKPIIMTRVSDYNTLIDDSNGVLCDWNNAETIKDALLKLINVPVSKLLKMGESSRKKANVLFSKEQITNKWIELIEK